MEFNEVQSGLDIWAEWRLARQMGMFEIPANSPEGRLVPVHGDIKAATSDGKDVAVPAGCAVYYGVGQPPKWYVEIMRESGGTGHAKIENWRHIVALSFDVKIREFEPIEIKGCPAVWDPVGLALTFHPRGGAYSSEKVMQYRSGYKGTRAENWPRVAYRVLVDGLRL